MAFLGLAVFVGTPDMAVAKEDTHSPIAASPRAWSPPVRPGCPECLTNGVWLSGDPRPDTW